MTHHLADRDIEEIFRGYVSWSTEDIIHVNYIGPTQSTYYTREDLHKMLDILDGKEEGVERL